MTKKAKAKKSTKKEEEVATTEAVSLPAGTTVDTEALPSMFPQSVREPLESDEVDLAPEATVPPAVLASMQAAPLQASYDADEMKIEFGPSNDSFMSKLEHGMQKSRVEAAKAEGLVTVNVIERLVVDLAEHEVNERARAMAGVLAERDDLENEMKGMQAKYKAEIKTVDAHLSELREAVSTRRETQKVECVQVFDPKRERTWFLYRGKRVGDRLMSTDEIRETTRNLFREPPMLPNRLDRSVLERKAATTEELAKKAAQQVEAQCQANAVKAAAAEALPTTPPPPPEDDFSNIEMPDNWSPVGKTSEQVIKELEENNPDYTFSQNDKGYFVPKLKPGVVTTISHGDGAATAETEKAPKPKRARKPKPAVTVQRAVSPDEGSTTQDIHDVMRSEKSVRGKTDHAV